MMYALEYQITTHTKDTRNIEAHRREKKWFLYTQKYILKKKKKKFLITLLLISLLIICYLNGIKYTHK